MNVMLAVCGYGVCLFLGLTCATLLWFIWIDRIDLSKLLSEADGSASMSRFQLLIFTMVVAISMYIMVERTGAFPQIPDGVLVMLGISASTYAVSKGISYSRPEGVTTPEERADTRKKAAEISATGAETDATPAEISSSGAKNV